MTVYTIWDGTTPPGTTSTVTGPRTDGLLITVTEGGFQLEAVAFYVPAAETELDGTQYTAIVWTTTSGTAPDTELATQAGTGTFTPGEYNWITLAVPVPVSPGVFYEAAVSSPDMIQFVHNYWGFGGAGSGGAVSGPVAVPGYSAAPGNNQQGSAPSAATFPAASTGSWYGIDVQVGPVPAPAVSGLDGAARLILGLP